MQNDETNNLNIGRASKYLGVSIDTLRRWEKKGKLITYRSPGGHRYFKKDDLDKLFNTRYERTNADLDPKQTLNNTLQEQPIVRKLEETEMTAQEPNIRTFDKNPQETPTLEQSPTIKTIPTEISSFPTSQDLEKTNVQNLDQATPISQNPETINLVEENLTAQEPNLGTESHTHLPIPEENFSFTPHPDATFLLTENPKLELKPAETEIITSSETPKSIENETDFKQDQPVIKSGEMLSNEELLPKQSILVPKPTNTYELNELQEKPWTHIPTEPIRVEDNKSVNLSEIVTPEKPKNESKFFSYAVWGILVFSIIDLVMFFLWFSSTKIISPIP